MPSVSPFLHRAVRDRIPFAERSYAFLRPPRAVLPLGRDDALGRAEDGWVVARLRDPRAGPLDADRRRWVLHRPLPAGRWLRSATIAEGRVRALVAANRIASVTRWAGALRRLSAWSGVQGVWYVEAAVPGLRAEPGDLFVWRRGPLPRVRDCSHEPCDRRALEHLSQVYRVTEGGVLSAIGWPFVSHRRLGPWSLLGDPSRWGEPGSEPVVLFRRFGHRVTRPIQASSDAEAIEILLEGTGGRA